MLHRLVELAALTLPEPDWAGEARSPESDPDPISGVKKPIMALRPGVEVAWTVTFYDGAGNDAAAVAGGSFEGELVYEMSQGVLDYKAMVASGAVLSKHVVLERDLPTARQAWVRIIALSPPGGATHARVVWHDVERRGI